MSDKLRDDIADAIGLTGGSVYRQADAVMSLLRGSAKETRAWCVKHDRWVDDCYEYGDPTECAESNGGESDEDDAIVVYHVLELQQEGY
jgi:hypothetical protein